MFGKKKKPEVKEWMCCNLPTDEIVVNYTPDGSGEMVQFYLFPVSATFEHEGREFYMPNELVTFPQYGSLSGGYPFSGLEMFSGGKCTLWRMGAKGDEQLGIDPNTIIFELSTRELKLNPALFKLLARERMGLVRASAHRDWHWNHGAYDHYPNITQVWKPAYAEPLIAAGTPDFTLLSKTPKA